MMPLLGLIAGTGSIGPEIDEGSIVYLLAKPLNRYTIVAHQAGRRDRRPRRLRRAPGLRRRRRPHRRGGLGDRRRTPSARSPPVSPTPRSSCCLAVITRNAVVVGLIYALIWETLIGGLVPGAQTLSRPAVVARGRQAGLRRRRLPLGIGAAVEFSTGLVALLVVTIGATAYAGRRLQTLRLHDDS